MTSGTFKTVPVESVWIDRAKRQRRDLSGIEELADSIRRVGLIHPPVIRASGELVAGERRFTAIKSLGWTALPVQFIEDLPEHEIRQVELEENVRRVDLSWQDQCLAVAEYHETRAREPQWTLAKTAEALGYSLSHVNQRLDVAREIRGGNQRVIDAPKYSTARNVVERTRSRARQAEAEVLTDEPPVETPILNLDFHRWSEVYDGPKFNLIHCDFPYGINADKHDQGASKTHGGYQDTFNDYVALISSLHKGMDNVVAESAHLIFWFSMDYYDETLRMLTAMGWKVDPFPLIWFKSDNTGILPDSQRGPRRIYESAFFASRGDRKVVQAVSNAVAAPVTKLHHMSEKPLLVLNHFFRMVCDEHTTLLDPTCGGGNALVAASKFRAGRVMGLEINDEFYQSACANWRSSVGSEA